MKQFIFSTLVTVSVFACISCDRHEWENSAEGVKDGTKNLFHAEEKHDAHSSDDNHSDHGQTEEKHDSHAAPAEDH